MMILYAIVILGSALLVSLIGCRIFTRILREVEGPMARAELACVISAIAFYTVVSLPAGAVIAAIVATLLGYFQRSLALPALRSIGPLALVVAFALVGVAQSPGAWPAVVPGWVFLLPSALVLVGMIAVAERQHMLFLHYAGVSMAAGVPLMVAPLLFSTAHHSLALDHAILCAALLGGILGLKPAPTALLLRLPVAMLLAYQIVQAAHYGAWPLAVLALLIWVGGMIAVGRRAAA